MICFFDEFFIYLGAGAFYVAAADMLREKAKSVKGRASLAVEAFGEAVTFINNFIFVAVFLKQKLL